MVGELDEQIAPAVGVGRSETVQGPGSKHRDSGASSVGSVPVTAATTSITA